MKTPIVILHGWGKSGNDYQSIQNLFEKQGYTVFAPDLPGFGKETLKRTMVLQDYVNFVKDYLKKKRITKTILVGHSFGGRVAAKLTAQSPSLVEKLILTGAPLIKQPLSLKKQIITALVKPAKKMASLFPTPLQQLFTKTVYRFLGEWDYYKAGKMKETFKNVIAEDLKKNLPLISVPTYIIWGGKDTFVSEYIGKQISQIIPHADFTSIPEASHKLPYENPSTFAEHILRFLK